jgi:predicted dehydrogenase
VILAALQKIPGWNLRGVVSKGGLSAAHVAGKYQAAWAGTEIQGVWDDKATQAVMIMTRHNAHAAQVMAALKAGKHVWVEKPLALTLDDVAKVQSVAEKAGRVLFVGFNRRYSPALVPLKAKLDAVSGPKQVLVRVNAGRLEDGGWQQSAEGGGRLLGEVCHFTDLCLWMVSSELETVHAVQAAGQDDYVVTLRFKDGSVATVFYTSEGDPSAPKERVEVYGGGGCGVMDNYIATTWVQGGRKRRLYKKPLLTGQEKGHAVALKAWLAACGGQQGVLPGVGALCFSSQVTLWAAQSIASGEVVRVK